PPFLTRWRGADGRPKDLDSALDVGVAALALRKRGRRQDDSAVITFTWQVVPRGDELHRPRYPGRRRGSPDQKSIDSVELVPAPDARCQRAALVGRSVERHLLAAQLLRQVAARRGQLIHVFAPA